MEHWQQVKRIVEQVLDCPQAEREALLDAACGSDDALRREVMGLIASEGEADRFFECAAPEADIEARAYSGYVIAFLTDTRVIGRILEALVEWGKKGALPASVAELATTAE